MITTIDSSVFFDVIAGTPQEALEARTGIAIALQQGVLVISVVVYAELAARFKLRADLDLFLESWRCTVEPLDSATAHLADIYFKEYRQRGGTRTRILPDFLIAAHTELNADRILTRDARFFGDTFPRLVAATPAELATP